MNPTRALPNTGARTHPGPLSLPVYSSQLSLHLIPKITTILYFVFIIALLKKKLIPDPIKLFFFQLSMFLNFILAVYYVEKAMAPHSNTLAWKIPWTEEPGRLQSMGSRRVGYD